MQGGGGEVYVQALQGATRGRVFPMLLCNAISINDNFVTGTIYVMMQVFHDTHIQYFNDIRKSLYLNSIIAFSMDT